MKYFLSAIFLGIVVALCGADKPKADEPVRLGNPNENAHLLADLEALLPQFRSFNPQLGQDASLGKVQGATRQEVNPSLVRYQANFTLIGDGRQQKPVDCSVRFKCYYPPDEMIGAPKHAPTLEHINCV